MRKMKKLLAVLGLLCCLAGCNKQEGMQNAGEGGNPEKGMVYLYNFKAEAKNEWQEVAKQFTEETGIDMKITSFQNHGSYAEEIDELNEGRDVPTLINTNGLSEEWEKIAVNLADTNFYKMLSDDVFAIHYEDKVVAVSYTVEGYGIIYNKEIMNRYFALKDRQTQINSVDEICSQSDFELLVQDMDAHKEALSIEAVFASVSLMPGEQWRWTTHLFNMPLYYEYQDKNTDRLEEFSFTYADAYRRMFDLYLNYSIADVEEMKTTDTEDSMQEFAAGRCAMVQNGCWSWSTIDSCADKKIADGDIGILPIYFDAGEQSLNGLCVGTETYWYINSKADKDDQAATLAFLDWLFQSDSGKKLASEKLGLIPPMNTFTEEDMPSNPLATAVIQAVQGQTVQWTFSWELTEEYKQEFGELLASYAQGTISWEEVVSWMRENWSKYNSVE